MSLHQGSGGDTHSQDRPTTSRKASLLPTKLVCDNSGPVGPEHGQGYQIGLVLELHQRSLPTPPQPLLSSEPTNSRGNNQSYPETS